jgi:hypothetical protein
MVRPPDSCDLRRPALKDRRRVRVGEHLTFLFENRETVRYQIQEMMRIERIVDLPAIRHEVESYNELIPPAGGLSACLLIEYAAAEERDEKLRELLGLEEHVWLVVAGRASRPERCRTRIHRARQISFQKRHW